MRRMLGNGLRSTWNLITHIAVENEPCDLFINEMHKPSGVEDLRNEAAICQGDVVPNTIFPGSRCQNFLHGCGRK